MKEQIAVEKGMKFVNALRTGAIRVDRRTNHGEEFYGAHEKQHRENFHAYLGSCIRYLCNKRIEERKYHG